MSGDLARTVLDVATMRVLATAALLLAALTSSALAQPGATPPSSGYGPTYGPPPQQPPPPPPPAGYGGGYNGGYYGGGYAQPYQQPYQPQQPAADIPLKSSGTALMWSLGTTALGIVGIAAAFEEQSEGLLIGGGLLTLVGPSAGHIYADESSHAVKGSLLRAGGLVIFTLGAIEADSSAGCYDAYYCEDDSDGEAAMWIGGLIVVGSALYDIYDGSRAAQRYNDKARKRALNMNFAPTMMSKSGGGVTPGLAFSGAW